MPTDPIFKSKDSICRPDTGDPLAKAAQAGKIKLKALARGNYPGIKLGSELPGIRNLGYWDAPYSQNWKLDWHRNEGIEICFLETGNLLFGVESKQCHLQPGDITLTRPWQSHYLGNPAVEASRLHWLILDVEVRRPNQPWKWPKWIILSPEEIQELTTFLNNTHTYVWKSTLDIKNCFKKISYAVDLSITGSKISRLAIDINDLLACILEMFRQYPVTIKPDQSVSRDAVEIFSRDLVQYKQYLIHSWTVESMAKECGLGISQFRNYFKQITNMNPINYLNYHRIQLAQKMLTEKPDICITDIAMSCGFQTSQYFATVFREFNNTSPTEYRKNQNIETSLKPPTRL